MTNYIDEEFNRVMSNPDNEIISESLKGRLKGDSSGIEYMLTFSDNFFEASLESFHQHDSLQSISLFVSKEVVLKIIKGESFTISGKNSEDVFESDKLLEISSFKMSNDNYILSVTRKREVVEDD